MRSRRRHRWLAGLGGVLLVTILVAGFGHAGQHMARSLLVPGAGLYDERPLVGAALTVLAVATTVTWLRWGVDWALAAVFVAGMVTTGLLTGGRTAASAAATAQAAHEFPLVILVLAALAWLRQLVRRLPRPRPRGVGSRRRTGGLAGIGTLPPVERCQAAAIAALAGPWPEETVAAVVSAIESADVEGRAGRIGLVARGRRGGDPLRGDHAHTRAALALWDRLDPHRRSALGSDAERAWAGVPASEPGWTRLLDGTLAAIALSETAPEAARRWVEVLRGPMALGRAHRPAWVWTPLAIPAGRPDDWEHAAATALARARGWIGDDDWEVLRPRALGAAARGTAHWADERLVAAGRLWSALVGDGTATRLLARPTVGRDPLASALDRLATRIIAGEESRT